ncbi:MAG: hypothetical protein AAF567_08660 [Actinomycetota bacterium]
MTAGNHHHHQYQAQWQAMPPGQPPKRRRRWPFVVLLIVLAAGGAAAGWYFYDQSRSDNANGDDATTTGTSLEDGGEPAFLDDSSGTTAPPSATAPLRSTLARHPEVTFAVGFPEGWDVGWESFSGFPRAGFEVKRLDGFPDGTASGADGYDPFRDGNASVLLFRGGPLTFEELLAAVGSPGSCTDTGSVPTPFQVGRFSGSFVDYGGCGEAGTGIMRRSLAAAGTDTHIYLIVRSPTSAMLEQLHDTLLLTATDQAPQSLDPPRAVPCVQTPISTDPAFPTVVTYSNETEDTVSYELVVDGQVRADSGPVNVAAGAFDSRQLAGPVTMRFTYATGLTADYVVTDDAAQCVRVTVGGLVQG